MLLYLFMEYRSLYNSTSTSTSVTSRFKNHLFCNWGNNVPNEHEGT